MLIVLGTEAIEIIRKEGLSIPVRALNTVVLFISHRLQCKFSPLIFINASIKGSMARLSPMS